MFEVATPKTPLHAVSTGSAVGLGMAACDPLGRLTFLSAPLRDLLGESFGAEAQTEPAGLEQLFQQDGLTRVRPEDLPLARARLGEVVVDAVICHRSEAKAIPTFLRCNAAPVAAGSVNGAVVFVENLTPGHEGRQVRQGRQHLDDYLISTLNHELRTPLSKLVGYAEILHDMRSQLPVNAVHSMEKICQAADELRELADLISCMGDLDTPGRLTGAVPPEVPEQLARGRLRSVPRIPLQLVSALDEDTVTDVMAALTEGAPLPPSER
jgi:signal transduction histidine kinase